MGQKKFAFSHIQVCTICSCPLMHMHAPFYIWFKGLFEGQEEPYFNLFHLARPVYTDTGYTKVLQCCWASVEPTIYCRRAV